MHQSRIQDQENGITKSRSGKSFSFQSPIPGVHIYDDVWPDSDSWFKLIETEEYWDEASKSPMNIKWQREDYMPDDPEGKKSQTCWVWHDPIIQNALGEVVDSYLHHWNLDPHSRESLRVSKFSGKGEFFGMHPDDSFATPRTASMVYYPTDDYEGGELEFIHFGVKIKPKAGQLFMFPSGYNMEHRVHELTSGTRVTLVTFFNQITPEERRSRFALIGMEPFYKPNLKSVFSPEFGLG